jgi:hypothetical protein
MLGSPRFHFKKPGDALGCIGARFRVGRFHQRLLKHVTMITSVLCFFYSNAINLRCISASLRFDGVRRHSSCDDATQELELEFLGGQRR